MTQILVVDDEVGIRELLSEILEDEGYQVRLAENAGQAREVRAQGRPDLVLLDIWMPDTDGITLLKEWASSGLLTMPVVMMSGHGTIDTAVEATRIGAYDFLEKPIALQKLLSTVGRALRQGVVQPKPALSLASLGRASLISDLKQRLERVGNLKTPVLLTAEPGCGVELCARFLHRPNTPWVAPESLAILAEAPVDLLTEAKEGTLFLSEVGNLNKLEQKGLTLLVSKLDKYNVRLVCASAKSLPELVTQGAFDSRLLQSLSGLTIRVPSLREHREDVPELANLFLSRLVEAREAPSRSFSTAALNALRNCDWPGNLSQLEATVKTLALTALQEEISLADVNRVLAQFDVELPTLAKTLPLHLTLREARDAFERVYFEHHIAREGGNMSRVAEKVGLERTHLYRKLKQLGVRLSRRVED
ncbi:MAG: sigma-54-dependent Fis family transcriptional regulator [Betaproteobacteria bacterium]|nr:sigma-54-dependent Fis family transcriptional regulator [Betaproteobacteria bacterium]